MPPLRGNHTDSRDRWFLLPHFVFLLVTGAKCLAHFIVFPTRLDGGSHKRLDFLGFRRMRSLIEAASGGLQALTEVRSATGVVTVVAW